VEAWMEALTEGLQAEGVEVVTALARGRFHDPERYAEHHRVSNPLAVDGSPFREVRIANLLRVFERIDPDVILPANLSDAALAAGFAKTRGGRARLAVCLHGQGDQQLDFVARVAPFVDLATSVSKRVAARLGSVIGEPQRVRHIPTGVPPPQQPVRDRQALEAIAYVGRLDQEEKRILDAIPLIRGLRDTGIVFHFVGTGRDEARIREELRGERVIFHGHLGRDALYRDLYPRVDALLVFSEAEAGPIVAWEAMVHGVVPIVSDYVGRTEEAVIRDGETGLVFPVGDMGAAAERIRRLVANGGIAALSRNARGGLPEVYQAGRFVATWRDALQECVALPGRCASAAMLPSLVSSGRLSRLGLGVGVMSKLRRLVGAAPPIEDPGAEWPH
jgi:glycosyltransferase involved in cell wall biosynthesis